MRLAWLPLLLLCTCAAYAARPCISPDEAADHPEKDICVSAHVYDVVESPDGTRYLDVCKPGSTDAACRFTVISLPMDRKDVGELENYREQDIHIRGVVHVMHGQSTIVLSHARQFRDGAEKFRANPALLAGFSAESSRTAFRDPALSARRHKSDTAFSGNSH